MGQNLKDPIANVGVCSAPKPDLPAIARAELFGTPKSDGPERVLGAYSGSLPRSLHDSFVTQNERMRRYLA
jgi:hypothetical protein